MRLAIISDIHSNLPALKAVLSDIEEKKVDLIFCTGDLVGYAPFPNEVIELIKKKNIICVQGNYDEAVGNDRFICGCEFKDEKEQELGMASILWTRSQVSETNKKFLRSLPIKLHLTFSSFSLLLVHGSPWRQNEYLTADLPEQYLEEMMKTAGADILVCGHTHIPYYRHLVNNRHLINAGSVGKPKHGNPRASYVIINLEDNASPDTQERLKVEICYVEYDVELTARTINQVGLPEEFALRLRQGI